MTQNSDIQNELRVFAINQRRGVLELMSFQGLIEVLETKMASVAAPNASKEQLIGAILDWEYPDWRTL